MLKKQLETLYQISKNKISIIITNQVYTNIENNSITIVGGNLMKSKFRCLMRLEKNPRKLVLEKPLKKEYLFEIKNEGIILK